MRGALSGLAFGPGYLSQKKTGSFRRQIRQKPEANMVGVEVSMSEGTPTHSRY